MFPIYIWRNSIQKLKGKEIKKYRRTRLWRYKRGWIFCVVI